MDTSTGTAIYLAGHGSKTRPRLIDLQYQRILRYRRALLSRHNINRTFPLPFIDLRLPGFGAGHVTLNEVPRFVELYRGVKDRKFDTVFIDVEEVRPGLTPDYESAFIRILLEEAGAVVLNAYTDDESAFKQELKERCGPNASEDDVTDSADFVGFFPALAGEIASATLTRELQDSGYSRSEEIRRINARIDALKRLRPYAGGGIPFVDDRLAADWRKLK
jgi:hypothetical protein